MKSTIGPSKSLYDALQSSQAVSQQVRNVIKISRRLSYNRRQKITEAEMCYISTFSSPNQIMLFLQTSILWKDPKQLSWDHRTSYKFVLSLNSARKKVRLVK